MKKLLNFGVLLDSGSRGELVRYDLIEKLRMTDKIKKEGGKIIGFGGGTQDIMGVTDLPMEIAGI